MLLINVFFQRSPENACHSSEMNLIYETILGNTEFKKRSVLFAEKLYATPSILDRSI